MLLFEVLEKVIFKGKNDSGECLLYKLYIKSNLSFVSGFYKLWEQKARKLLEIEGNRGPFRIKVQCWMAKDAAESENESKIESDSHNYSEKHY